MRWTKELPQAEGYYWYRPDGQSRANFAGKAYMPQAIAKRTEVVYRVAPDSHGGGFHVLTSAAQHSCRAMAGEWGGPIQKPEEASSGQDT